jgi:hypothetical protein
MTTILGLGRRSAAFLIDVYQSEFISFLISNLLSYCGRRIPMA